MYMLTYGSFENFCDVMVSQLTLDSHMNTLRGPNVELWRWKERRRIRTKGQICKLKYNTTTTILIVKLNLHFKKMYSFLIDVRGYKAVSL
jgi:hypothetical protein